MRKSRAERVREWRRKNGDPIRIGEDGRPPEVGLAEIMAGGPLNKTQLPYFLDPSRYKAYKGPAGCGKTVISAVSGLSRALWQPGSIGIVAQHEYNDLLNSTAQTMEACLRRLPEGTLLDREKNPPMKWIISPIGGGEPSTIIFMGLKDNLGGYEANWAFVDEADKVPEKAVRLLDGRLRHAGGGYSLMLAFNPPSKDHWLYTACTGRDSKERQVSTPWVSLYEPEPNENSSNLPAGYYDNLRKSYTPDMVQRLIDGEWGSTFSGMPVFKEFSFGMHVKDFLLQQFDPNRPLLRFWDFGYNHPYCCWAQVDWEGRLLVFHEKVEERVEATDFARRCLAETKTRFPSARDVLDYGDPAVRQKKDTGSTLAVMARAGITMRYKISNIEPGLQLIRQRLSTLIDGRPAIVFDRAGCPLLISALRGGYHMDGRGERPVKDGTYDHSVDAFRYGVINVLGLNASYKLPASIEYRPEFDTFDSQPQEEDYE